MLQRKALRWFRLWWSCGILLVVVVWYQSLSATPIESPAFEGGDKLGHFLVYFGLMSWFAQLYHRSAHHGLLCVFVGMGVALEILQGQTGYRMFEYADMLANSTGALLAWGLARGGYKDLMMRFESRLLVRQA